MIPFKKYVFKKCYFCSVERFKSLFQDLKNSSGNEISSVVSDLISNAKDNMSKLEMHLNHRCFIWLLFYTRVYMLTKLIVIQDCNLDVDLLNHYISQCESIKNLKITSEDQELLEQDNGNSSEDSYSYLKENSIDHEENKSANEEDK